MKNFHFSGNSTPMKKSIILISALSMLGLMLVSCSSSTPATTTTTTRQTTVTAPPTTQRIPAPSGGVKGADPVEIGRH
jgi:hypothetical protein